MCVYVCVCVCVSVSVSVCVCVRACVRGLVSSPPDGGGDDTSRETNETKRSRVASSRETNQSPKGFFAFLARNDKLCRGGGGFLLGSALRWSEFEKRAVVMHLCFAQTFMMRHLIRYESVREGKVRQALIATNRHKSLIHRTSSN